MGFGRGIAVLAAVWLGLSADGTVAADAATGQRLAVRCASCHGLDGVSHLAGVPHIAGQNENYIFKALCDFHGREFPGCRADTPMNERAPSLSIAEMEHIAAWYARQRCPTPEPPVSRSVPRAVTESCANCHGVEGRNHSALTPVIAGQRSDYLLDQLRHFASTAMNRTREHPLMDVYASRYSDADLVELARWYAAQSCE